MQSIIILIVENKKLRAANEKIKKKRQKKKSYVGKKRSFKYARGLGGSKEGNN